MLISEFDYELPPEQIAQEPLAAREASRMLIVNRAENNWRDDEFKNIGEFLRAGDCLVLNNTRVFPARLVGRRDGFTGRVELFLVREIESEIWETLARPARRLQAGTKLVFGDNNELCARVREKQPDGRLVIEFESAGEFDEVLETIGQTPLPPYISRAEKPSAQDRERYQTVFARTRGAIAAPTAGLHFTPEILNEIKRRGAEIAEITLHVGYGTFEPVRVADTNEHRVAPERFEITPAAAETINQAKSEKRRVIAVGTTTTRALESAANASGEIEAGGKNAALTVTPGYEFRIVDGLLTNFHLPQSSLLILVSTFAGYDLTMRAYRRAVAAKYRFYSYGDCMLIV